jgi:hypothetical protein
MLAHRTLDRVFAALAPALSGVLLGASFMAPASGDGDLSFRACHPLPGSQAVVGPFQLRDLSARLDNDPGQGLDWPDTEIGVVREPGAAGYLFFASNGSCHRDCDDPDLNLQEFGSFARIPGALDTPLGTVDAPAAPYEFRLDSIANVPVNYDGSTNVRYVGGGPVYRVPPGEPGAGGLLLVYQGAYDTDQLDQGWYSFLGIAKSEDDGKHWTDLGVMIRSTARPEHGMSVDIGDGDLVDSGNTDPAGRYFYIYFPDAFIYPGESWDGTTYSNGILKGMAVARVDYEEFLSAAFPASPAPPPIPAFKKFYDPAVLPWLAPASNSNFARLHRAEYWQQPGIGGDSTNVWNTNSPYAGDMNVKWSSGLNRFVAVFNAGLNVGMAFSADGLDWTPTANLVTSSGSPAPNLGSSTLVGMGEDPNVLGSEFYVYYMAYPTNGYGWERDTLNRLTITCRP